MVCLYRVRRIFRRVRWLAPLLLLFLLTGLSACGTSAGIFHAAGNWASVKGTGAQIYSLATDPNNSQRIYAGTGDATLLLSQDGGTSWKKVSLPLSSSHNDPVSSLGFDSSGKHLYATAGSTLLVSADNGVHWQTITSPSLPADQYTALSFDFEHENTLFLGTATHGILASTDSGHSWQSLNANWPAHVTVKDLIYVTDLHQLWAATSQGVYLKRGDAGWQAMNNGLSGALTVNAVAPLAYNGGDEHVVLAGTSRGFFRSLDGGAHWTASKDSLSAISINTILVDFRSTTLSQVYVGTSAGVLVSEDQGQTWGGVATGLAQHTDIRALTIGSTDNTQLFAGADAVYLYPGSSSGGGGTSWLIIIFFGALVVGAYVLLQRNRRRSLDHWQRNIDLRMAEQVRTDGPLPESSKPKRQSSAPKQ